MHRENVIFTVARLSLEESRRSERSPERIEYFAHRLFVARSKMRYRHFEVTARSPCFAADLPPMNVETRHDLFPVRVSAGRKLSREHVSRNNFLVERLSSEATLHREESKFFTPAPVRLLVFI